MKVTIKKSKLNGNINIIPSKSYAHRLLFAAMLSNDCAKVSNVELSDDIKATLDCIKNYGRDFFIDGKTVKFSKKENNDILNLSNKIPIFNCNESGTTLRMFLPIALTKYNHFIIKAKKRLIERGISIYEEIFEDVEFIKSEDQIEVIGNIKPGIFNVKGNISSQYISGLLYALPLLNEESVINITTKLESKNYIDMTLDVLKKSSVCIRYNNSSGIDNKITNISFNIKGNQKYGTINEEVEADFSNAAFIDVYNYLGSSIVINNLKKDSLQGDKIYKEYFEVLNSRYDTIDISNCIDLGPVLFAFSSLKNGGKFIGTKRLKIKESDRAIAMKLELEKFGVKVTIDEDEVIIDKTKIHEPVNEIDTHNDHRIAMSMAMFSSEYDIVINNAEVVNKSYPKFFDDLEKLGANITYE